MAVFILLKVKSFILCKVGERLEVKDLRSITGTSGDCACVTMALLITVFDRNAQLLQERMRQSGKSKFFHLTKDKQFILLDGSSPQLCNLEGEVVAVFPSCEGAIGHQICPINYHFLAFVLDGDIFLSDSRTGKIHRLTFTKGIVCSVSSGLVWGS